MRDFARQPDLALEVLERLRIAGERLLHHFDDDVFFEPLIARLEDFSHAAFPEVRDQAEAIADRDAGSELAVRDGGLIAAAAARDIR